MKNDESLELTPKRYKLLMLIGAAIALICGPLGLVAGAVVVWLDVRSIIVPSIFVVLAVVGLMVYGAGKTLAWWHHG